MILRDEQHATGARRAESDDGQRAGATGWAPAPARRGVAVGDRVHRTLRGGAACVCRLSVRLCAVDGRETLALCRAVRGPALSDDARQHRALRGVRCEFEDVFGAAAVRFLLAAPLVDQGLAGSLYLALADRDGAGLRLIPLDADRPARLARRSAIGAVWDRWPHLVQPP